MITGGEDGEKTRGEIYQLDTKTWSWVEVARMKSPRYGHGLSVIKYSEVEGLCSEYDDDDFDPLLENCRESGSSGPRVTGRPVLASSGIAGQVFAGFKAARLASRKGGLLGRAAARSGLKAASDCTGPLCIASNGGCCFLAVGRRGLVCPDSCSWGPEHEHGYFSNMTSY